MKSINLKINKNLYLIVLLIAIFLSFIIGYSIISSDLLFSSNIKTKKYSCTQANLYERISCMSTPDSISSSYVTPSTGISFASKNSDTNGKGLYTLSSTLGDAYPIKYFRGNIDNNNLVFGGFCWKIVRTTDTGGTKILYNGVPDSNGYCNGDGDKTIGVSPFNNSSLTLNGVGYMTSEKEYLRNNKNMTDNTETIIYGTDVTYDTTTKKYTLINHIESNSWATDSETILNNKHYTCFSNTLTCENVNYIYSIDDNNKLAYITLSTGEKVEDAIENMLSEDNNKRNFKNSDIKTVVDEWFENNLTAYQNKIEDTIYCNDRSYEDLSGWNKDRSSSDNKKNNLYFSTYQRLLVEKNIFLECPKKIDSFTVSPSIGNGKLEYPIGLLTAEEIALAGGVYWSKNIDCYTTIDKYYYLMSPYGITATEFQIVTILGPSFNEGQYHGALVGWGGSNSQGVRPVISLKNDSSIASGDGTSNSPYVID